VVASVSSNILVNGEVLDELFSDEREPLQLLGRKFVFRRQRIHRVVHAFLGGQHQGLRRGGVLDDGDHIGQRLVAGNFVRLLELALVKLVLRQRAAECSSSVWDF
jgi:hypothetical protein